MKKWILLVTSIVFLSCGSTEFTDAGVSLAPQTIEQKVSSDAVGKGQSGDLIVATPSPKASVEDPAPEQPTIEDPKDDEPVEPIKVSGAFLTGTCRHLMIQSKEYIGCQIVEDFDASRVSKSTLAKGTQSKDIGFSSTKIASYDAIYDLEDNHDLEGEYELSMFEKETKIFKAKVDILKSTETFNTGTGNLSVNLYQLPVNTSMLPDFSTMTAVDTFTFANLAVEAQPFDQGFPGVEDLFEWFGLEITGNLEIPVDGEVTFKTLSDDGVKVYVDDVLVLVDDGTHAPREKASQKLNLTKGVHKIKVEYFQGPRYQVALKLMWKINDLPEEVIPPTAFIK